MQRLLAVLAVLACAVGFAPYAFADVDKGTGTLDKAPPTVELSSTGGGVSGGASQGHKFGPQQSVPPGSTITTPEGDVIENTGATNIYFWTCPGSTNPANEHGPHTYVKIPPGGKGKITDNGNPSVVEAQSGSVVEVNSPNGNTTVIADGNCNVIVNGSSCSAGVKNSNSSGTISFNGNNNVAYLNKSGYSANFNGNGNSSNNKPPPPYPHP